MEQDNTANNVVDPTACNDINQLINGTANLITSKLNEFQGWLMENPQSSANGPILQEKRQELKILNLRLGEYQRMKLTYETTIVPPLLIQTDIVYSKQRTNDPVADMRTTKVASGRPIMKISR